MAEMIFLSSHLNLYKLCSGKFIPFFMADPFKLCQISLKINIMAFKLHIVITFTIIIVVINVLIHFFYTITSVLL